MTPEPFSDRSPNGNNSMQMPRIVPPNPRRRALVNASNTFNLNQTERFLTQRLIFGVGNPGTKWANKGEDVA
jgi:hypothetical protein